MTHHIDRNTLTPIRSKLPKLAALLVLAAITAPWAQAALIDAPLPANAYITRNGYDWAWGANCSSMGSADCSPIEYSFQSSQGWRIAQASDMALAPSAIDFLFPGANVPFNGTDLISGSSFDFLNETYASAASAGACASSYFTLGGEYNTCDWLNGSGQDDSINTAGWFNQNGEDHFYAEVLFIRAVPEPSALALFSMGATVLLTGMRRNKRQHKLGGTSTLVASKHAAA